ncbi:anthranilate synthase component 1 [Pseudomonas aeruginosa]|uniref:anthranilate synthase component 1 n=1 Tax=Pseudomonas aeruginosa TaxID=287 RepID=UPI0039BE547A
MSTLANLTEVLFRLDFDPDTAVYHYRGQTLSRLQCRTYILSQASQLARLLKPGDRVVLALNDSPSLACLFLACIAVGAIPAVINPKSREQALADIAADCQASLVVREADAPSLSGPLAPLTLRAAAGRPLLDDFSLDALVGPADLDWSAFHRQDPAAACFLQYTSGSTGAPKGVMHSLRNTLGFCRAFATELLALQAGDPSRSFSMPCADPWRAYRQLCLRNPSPYRFFLDAGDFCLFGASPESALKYDAESREVELYPIAGTRPRGRDARGAIDAELDNRLEAELRLDAKEIAEHMMLVDLARNDLARVCRSGTRQVRDMLKVDRYSHVMHLVSRVAGELHGELDALHAYRACLNMGTLVGAPKVRAMQLLRQYEDGYRGSYGGAIGILDSAGNLDTSIVIRSAEVREGIARVRAGAGVVLDSDPRLEAEETRNKALAVLTAVAAAERERGERDAHHAVG